MDFLDLPLSFQGGKFRRIAADVAYVKYVQLFFASRKYESLAALDYGINPDDLAWVTNEEYVRVLVDEFNRVHRGRFSLHIEGREDSAGETRAVFTLRQGKNNYRFKLALGSFSDA